MTFDHTRSGFNSTQTIKDSSILPTIQPDPQMEAAVVAHLTWRLVPFLFLLYIVAYLDRINVGFAALQMQQDLRLSDAVYGLGAGIFFAGYFLFQVPSNLVLQRVGARRWIATLMVAWGFISAAMALAQGPRSFYALRFLLGSAEAGFFPGVILCLKTWFPAAARARTVARFMTAAPLSGVIGGPVSGALLGFHPKIGLAGWQWMFLLEGIPAVLLGAAASVYLIDRPEDAKWLTPEQRSWLHQTLALEATLATAPGAAPIDLTWGALNALRMGRIWILAFAYFGLNAMSYGMSLWLPKLIQSFGGLSNFAIGMVSAIPYVAAAIVMVIVALHSDRTGERRWHTAGPAFLGAMALCALAFVHSVTAAVALITVAVMGVFSMMGPFWAMPTSFLSAATAAAGIAFINSVGNLGGFFGSYIIGRVRNSTGEFRGGLLALGGALAVSGALALAVRFDQPKRSQAES
jgi:MFS transporter, ACS family, tartrate transporter